MEVTRRALKGTKEKLSSKRTPRVLKIKAERKVAMEEKNRFMAREIRNIKYTYYHYGQGPYQDTHTGYCPEQSSYSSVEDMLQKTHPD